jgi:prevent-host-death family protein
MKKMAAGTFKIHCLSIMDEVLAKRETVLITKHGKPVAKLVPPDQTTDDIFGFLASKGKILGDIVAPVLSDEEWVSLSDLGRYSCCGLASVRASLTFQKGTNGHQPGATKRRRPCHLRHHVVGTRDVDH